MKCALRTRNELCVVWEEASRRSSGRERPDGGGGSFRVGLARVCRGGFHGMALMVRSSQVGIGKWKKVGFSSVSVFR